MRSSLLAVAAGFAAVALVTGCSGSSSPGSTANPGPSDNPGPSTPPSFSGSPRLPTHTPSSGSSPSAPQSQAPIPGADSALSKIVLTTGEVGKAGIPVTGGVYRGGTSVTDQKTLDECHATYPSESKRVARIQTGYVPLANPQGSQTASNEVVRYSDNGATQAYHEITQSLHHCPAHFPDGGKAVGSHTTIEAPDSQLTDEQITATQLVTVGHNQVWTAITFMYDGDLFSGVYVFRPTRAAALTADRQLAQISAVKLQAGFAAEGTQV